MDELDTDKPSVKIIRYARPDRSGLSLSPTFLHDAYYQENEDLNGQFAEYDELRLGRHYSQYGRFENRGMSTMEAFCFVDHVSIADDGTVLVVGWADRRILGPVCLRIRVGYYQYEISDEDLVWYKRADVNGISHTSQTEFGFVAVARFENFLIHPTVRISINNYLRYEVADQRFSDRVTMLRHILEAISFMADWNIAYSLEIGTRLHQMLLPIWKRYLRDVVYTEVFSTGNGEPCECSVLTVVYRDPAFLLQQIRFWGPLFADRKIEMVVLLSDVPNTENLIERIKAAAHIENLVIRVVVSNLNSGFSHANNALAQMARSSKLVFMNPDIFPIDNELPRIFKIKFPKDYLYGAMLYYGNQSLMHSGMYVAEDKVMHPGSGKLRSVLRVEHYGKGLTKGPSDIDHLAKAEIAPGNRLTSAALLGANKATFDKLGGFSTDYIFAYYEDADLNMRHVSAGGKIAIDTRSQMFHFEGMKINPSPFIKTINWLNRCHFSTIHKGWSELKTWEKDIALI